LIGAGTAMTPAAPAAMASPAAMPTPVMIVQPYGGFWIRVLAILIDSALINIVTVPIFLIIGGASVAGLSRLGDNPSPEQVLPIILPMIALLIPLAICINWLYEALTTSSGMQATLGKRVCGLKVTDLAGNRIGFGRATGRHFSKIISGFMCIGYIMVAFTERKQGLHDMIAGTLVMKR
jgi:uncharacterized RDD family membrane protein YckC